MTFFSKVVRQVHLVSDDVNKLIVHGCI